MVQSVERAFAILGALSERPRGVTEIGRAVGLPKSTVARLLDTLESVGAVERAGDAGWRIAAVSPARSLALRVRPALARLVAELAEDAGLALPDGYDVEYVDQVASSNAVQVRDWTGTRAPMHTVPSGLVLLAEWPTEAVDAYAERGLVALTARTITDARTLRRRLREIRESGYAWVREEFADGIASVAAPVRDEHGNAIAAIHVHGPAYRFPALGDEERVEALVVRAAAGPP
jgi:DNA-binding IclR family transcriptional regulator